MAFYLMLIAGILIPVVLLLLTKKQTRASRGLAITGLLVTLCGAAFHYSLRTMNEDLGDDSKNTFVTMLSICSVLGCILGIISIFFLKPNK